MGNFGDVRNRRGEGPVRIIEIDRGVEALEGDKMECYCAITRRVHASVKHWNDEGVDLWETMLEITIQAACEAAPSARPFNILPYIATGGALTVYTSYSKTFCNKGCECDLSLPGGGSRTRSETCIGAMTLFTTNLTIDGPPKPLPEWASLLTDAGKGTQQDWDGAIAHSIAKEQGGQALYPPSKRKEKDKLGMGPYYESGHPECFSLEGKSCCESGDSGFGKETSLD